MISLQKLTHLNIKLSSPCFFMNFVGCLSCFVVAKSYDCL